MGKHDNLDELQTEMKGIKGKISEIRSHMSTRKSINPGSRYPIEAGYSTATRRPVRDIVTVLDGFVRVLDILIEDYEIRTRY